MARFGLQALRPAASVARGLRGDAAQALFAGNAAHSFLALEAWGTAAFGLMLSVAGHAVGWPIARGGSQRLADALVAHFRSLGGEVQVDAPVERLDELAGARIVMLDLGPRQVARLAGDRLPARYRQALERYRYGAAAFKLDWALDGPVPWTAPECLRAATVHLGGTLEEIAASEAAHERGEVHDRPFVLFVQPTLFDPSRAPAGQAHGLGLLPRPQRLDPGRHRPDRAAGRAVRAGLPRADPRAERPHARRFRAPERQPHRRRHQRRQDGPAPDLRPARRAADALPHPAPRASTSAPRRRRPAAACTAWAATSPRPPRWPTSAPDAADRPDRPKPPRWTPRSVKNFARRPMTQPLQNQLSRRERQIMDVLYRLGEAGAAEVVDHLSDRPAYNSVRVTLGILERKGVVRHRREGNRYVYSANGARRGDAGVGPPAPGSHVLPGLVLEGRAHPPRFALDPVVEGGVERARRLGRGGQAGAAPMSPLDLLDLLGGTLVRGGLILAVAFLGVWLLRRRSAAGRYAVWTAAFAGLTLLPALTLMLPVLEPPTLGRARSQW